MIIRFRDFLNEKLIHTDFQYSKKDRYYIFSKGKWIYFLSFSEENKEKLEFLIKEFNLILYPSNSKNIVKEVKEERPDIIVLEWMSGSNDVTYSMSYDFSQNILTSKELIDTLSYLKNNLGIKNLKWHADYEDEFSTADIIDVSQLLNDYRKLKNKKLSKIVYHGTSTYYLDSILKYGLSLKHGGSNFPIVHSNLLFFSSNFVDCVYYANQAARETDSLPIILEIDTTGMDESKIIFDYDFYISYIQKGIPEYDRFDWGEVENPKLSHLTGKYMGSVFGKFAYKGNIYPKWIKRICYKKTDEDTFDEWVDRDNFPKFQEFVKQEIQVQEKKIFESSFQFEHDVEKEFNYVNKLCFNNELKLPPYSFDINKNRSAWVQSNYWDVPNMYDKITLHFSKNCVLTPEQFRNTLTHEMIHLYLYHKNILKDYGGSHGVFFTREMDRINNMNVGIRITPKNDQITPDQERKGLKKDKDFYVLFFNYPKMDDSDEYLLCPFSVKDECEKFFSEDVIRTFKIYPPRKPVTVYMGKTSLYEINHFRIAKKKSQVKQFVISKDLFDKLIDNTEIYRKETFSR